jgi:thiol-disulfide isomerase/thioredoxin
MRSFSRRMRRTSLRYLQARYAAFHSLLAAVGVKLPMRKALILLGIAAICAGVAIHHFDPAFSWDTDASDSGSGPNPIAEMDQALPKTVLYSLDSRWVDLSTYKGQVVFIDFFATWCSGCVDEISSLIRFQQEFGDKGFTVVALAIDDQGDETVDSFVKSRRFPVNGTPTAINFPVYMGSMEIAQKAGFEGGLPAGVLVNREGQEVKIVRGVVSEAALRKTIQRVVRN